MIDIKDAAGKSIHEPDASPEGDERTMVLALDPAQYQLDSKAAAQSQGGGVDVHGTLNVLLRRKAKENNFKSILECLRDMLSEEMSVPPWLHDVFLGYGDPAAARRVAEHDRLPVVDFKDTFLDEAHLRDCFPGREVHVNASNATDGARYRLSIPALEQVPPATASGKRKKASEGSTGDDAAPPPAPIVAEAYEAPAALAGTAVGSNGGGAPAPVVNSVRFTPTQVAAIESGVQPGLTMIVGPPGTGKTDVAVQIAHLLFHNCPQQRTLLITHSNAALNDLFEKIMQRDVPHRYMLRLGMGEEDLNTTVRFSRQGRVDAMLARRLELLAAVDALAASLCEGQAGAFGYTCETANHFWLIHVKARWGRYLKQVKAAADAADAGDGDGEAPAAVRLFPFTGYFAEHGPAELRGALPAANAAEALKAAEACFEHLRSLFAELEECRPFELLKSQKDRSDHLMTRQARIVAMTCTHAALKRHDFLKLGLAYDNVIVEECAQILEVETFIPLVLQRPVDGRSRLKRCVFIGDHNQLPPVVQNTALGRYAHLDQSLFARFVKLGMPTIQLDAQGRARPELASLYSWRYKALGNLPGVLEGAAYNRANAGLAHTRQFIHVGDYQGRGESEPRAHFTQNLGEAEYAVALYQYLRLLGHPARSIAILATYAGQKALLEDVVARRCCSHPADQRLYGAPLAVDTVDRFQGQQADIVLVSLTRSRAVGHIRDVRRLVVAMSRARLGLYVLGRKELFAQCFELKPVLDKLLEKPERLELAFDSGSGGGAVAPERHPCARASKAPPAASHQVMGVEEMMALVAQAATGEWAALQHADTFAAEARAAADAAQQAADFAAELGAVAAKEAAAAAAQMASADEEAVGADETKAEDMETDA